MIFSSPPQFGQCSRSSSNTRLSSLAQLSRTGRWCAQFASHSAGFASWAAGLGPCGTTSARSLALGASAPWLAQRGYAHFAQRSYAGTKRIRCSLGLGTSAASRCMNSSGDITKCVVPSRQAVLSSSTTWPAALVQGALQRQHLVPDTRAEGNAIGLQGHAAACSGLSTRASSESLSLSAMYVDPSSSTNTPDGRAASSSG